MRKRKRRIPTFFWEYPKHTPPDSDTRFYRLRLTGMVERPMSLSLEDLRSRFQFTERRRRFYCVNGFSLEALWGGFMLGDVLGVAEPKGPFVRAVSLGGFEDTSPIDELVRHQAMLVTHMNGTPLELKRGKPIRLMHFHQYQFRAVKAVGELQVVAEMREGTWAKVGYTDATIQPYPHLAIDRDEHLMPDDNVLDLSRDNSTYQ